MVRLAPLLGAGIAAAFAAAILVPVLDLAPEIFTAANAEPGAAKIRQAVDRQQKSDRLAPARAAGTERPVITSVEVVGLRDAAIVYRDRDGRMLFRSDPVSNATVIAKGVALPQVTVKDTAQSDVSTVPAAPPPAPAILPTAGEQKVPVGCDPAFSPLHSSARSNVTGRCIADAAPLAPAQRLASLL
jgi:hypothetical protein